MRSVNQWRQKQKNDLHKINKRRPQMTLVKNSAIWSIEALNLYLIQFSLQMNERF